MNVSDDTQLPPHIGRYQPVSILGSGSQGVVYLAEDPKLERQVAIKTLKRHAGTDGRHLQSEARNVSGLQHPSIVPLYDFGDQDGKPYLVFQYVQGTPLSDLVRNGEAMEPARAIGYIHQILDAIGYAHDKGVLHRDLTPANIMLDGSDRPLILDFGISSMLAGNISSNEIVGTPSYMAPEVSGGKAVGPHTDIFSLGVILYELLTGGRLFEARNPMAIIYKIAHEQIAPPSARNHGLDEALDRIVLRALERDPGKRYQKAGSMRAALDRYLVPEDEPPAQDRAQRGGALEFLLRRIRRRPDFPAVSRHITEINQKSSHRGETTAHDLATIILKDYALSNKLLRLVNSASFGHFGGNISTISRAIVVLGFEQVKMAALSIMLFEHLSNASQRETLKDAACSAFFSGVLARRLAEGTEAIDPEQAFIAAMFHDIGRHLCICYFTDEYNEIERLMAAKGLKETVASRQILGVGYHELGMAIAREWQFPNTLVASMRPPPKGHQKATPKLEEQLSQLSAFSNEITRITGEHGLKESNAELDVLLQDYGECFRCDRRQLDKHMQDAMEQVSDYAKALNLDVNSSKVYRQLMGPQDEAGSNTASDTTGDVAEKDATAAGDDPTDTLSTDRDMILSNITEITNALVGDCGIQEIVDMVLETIYRGMGFERVLFCLRDARTQTVAARFGLGDDIEQVVPGFKFSLNHEDDLFTDAVRKHKDYVVLDTAHPHYQDKVPDWCRKLTNPSCMVVLPVVVKKRTIGLLYADSSRRNTRMTADFIKYFSTLRNQATLAFQQSTS